MVSFTKDTVCRGRKVAETPTGVEGSVHIRIYSINERFRNTEEHPFEEPVSRVVEITFLWCGLQCRD